MPLAYIPTYITWDDFKELTTVPELATILEDDFKKLARRAELLIDSFCGVQERWDPLQEREFPRSQDLDRVSGEPKVPDQIALATQLVIESLYLYGATKNPNNGNFLSESIGDYSYSKGKTGLDTMGLELIPSEAHQYLMGFRRRTVQISPPGGFGNGRLNSRQQFLKEQNG